MMHSVEHLIACRVRELRAARHWTLDEAATALGISRRSLVMIERGDANPNLTTLLRVASGLGVSLASLVETEQERPSVLLGEANGRVLWRTTKGSRASLLVASGALELWRWSIAPGDHRDGEPHSPGTLEALVVVEGELTLHVRSAETQVATGRSALFAGDQPHAYQNQGTTSVVFLLAVHEPVPDAEALAGPRGPAIS
jgi:transcriptional regulator with XRE-family HTH domain